MSRVYDVAFRNAVTGEIVHVEGHGNTHKSAKQHATRELVRVLENRGSHGLKAVRDYVHHSIKFKAQR